MYQSNDLAAEEVGAILILCRRQVPAGRCEISRFPRFAHEVQAIKMLLAFPVFLIQESKAGSAHFRQRSCLSVHVGPQTPNIVWPGFLAQYASWTILSEIPLSAIMFPDRCWRTQLSRVQCGRHECTQCTCLLLGRFPAHVLCSVQAKHFTRGRWISRGLDYTRRFCLAALP